MILTSGCVSQDPERTEAKSSRASAAIEVTIARLQTLNAAYERAQRESDAIAMAASALQRLQVVDGRLAEQDAPLFIENTVSMIQRAKMVAAGNQEVRAQLDALLADVDLEHEQTFGAFGQLFGNTSDALKRKRVRSYDIARESERLVRLNVADDIGVIVYVEAPFGRGVGLTLSDMADTVVCTDVSRHGSLICRHRPPKPGRVTAALSNPSPIELGVLMITNHPIAED